MAKNNFPVSRISHIIENALFEDIGTGDITTDGIISCTVTGHAEILVKESGVLAGLDIAEMVFNVIDETVVFTKCYNDGMPVASGTIIATVSGSLSSILKAERTALNFLQRMSGIATLTRRYVKLIEHTHSKITDTRKTVPGLRILDKLAVKCGGGTNHRFGLDDMVLIKDNHCAAAGGIANAIEKCLTFLATQRLHIKIEVETKNITEITAALYYRDNIHRIMLDNFSLDDLRSGIQLINKQITTEASGGVNLESVRQIAETGVDFISVGSLTHSPKALDIALNVHK
jgi:nicotinate-nucleotide pyrophosphorylase (carboxylating)